MQQFSGLGQVRNDSKLRKLQLCKRDPLRSPFRQRQRRPHLPQASLHGLLYLLSTRSHPSQSIPSSQCRNQQGTSTIKAAYKAPLRWHRNLLPKRSPQMTLIDRGVTLRTVNLVNSTCLTQVDTKPL